MNRQDAEDLENGEELNRQDAKIAKEEEARGGGRVESGPERGLDDLAHRVIGAAIEVHRHLGPGFPGGVDEDAMEVGFQLRGILHERQETIGIVHGERPVGEGRLDFLVGGCLIVELKAGDGFASIHKAQVMSYLKATRPRLGLLINFDVPILKDGLQRVILS